MKQMLKFTFDVNDVLKKTSSKTTHFDINSHACTLDSSRWITQKDIFERLPNVNSKGFCTLVSIYNAWDNIFNGVDDLVSFIQKQLELNHNYASLQLMTREINRLKHKKLLFNHDDLSNSYTIACENINHNKPIVISYEFNDYKIFPNPREGFGQHTVTIYGYSDYKIWYIENSEDNYLFTSLAIYIQKYLRTYGVDNIDNRDQWVKFAEEKDSKVAWKLAEDLLGYRNGGNGSAWIDKRFLVNDTYFRDSNCMITRTDDGQTFSDNCTRGSIPSKDFSYYDRLLEKLNSINYGCFEY